MYEELCGGVSCAHRQEHFISPGIVEQKRIVGGIHAAYLKRVDRNGTACAHVIKSGQWERTFVFQTSRIAASAYYGECSDNDGQYADYFPHRTISSGALRFFAGICADGSG